VRNSGFFSFSNLMNLSNSKDSVRKADRAASWQTRCNLDRGVAQNCGTVVRSPIYVRSFPIGDTKGSTAVPGVSAFKPRCLSILRALKYAGIHSERSNAALQSSCLLGLTHACWFSSPSQLAPRRVVKSASTKTNIKAAVLAHVTISWIRRGMCNK
jgi:hypothetical protein